MQKLKKRKQVKTKFRKLENPTVDLAFKNSLESMIDEFMPDWSYDLQYDKNCHYNIGMSGGADSTALGLVLLIKHPDIPWKLLACDTGNEPAEFHSILDIFAYKLGADVTIAYPEMTLFQKIDTNGYLPSGRSRWCTAYAKVTPWQDYIADVLDDPNMRCVNAAGLRYDERDRLGIIGIERVDSIHPFVSEKVERRAVMRLASEAGALSATYYRQKSRSGCLNCFFQSKQELIALSIWDPKQFAEGARVEKLSSEILQQLDDSKHPVPDLGFYSAYPLSDIVMNGKSSLEVFNVFGEQARTDDTGVNWDYQPRLNKRKRTVTAKSDEQDLFSDSFDQLEQEEVESEHLDLYVAVETLVHPLYRGNFGVYSQLPISWSTTVSGLSRSTSGYLYHRAMAADGFFDSLDRYDEHSHVTIYCLRFPRSIMPRVNYDLDGVYTWKQGSSYREVLFQRSAINRLCHYLASKQVIEHADRFDSMVVKQSKDYIANVEKSGTLLGELVGIGHFKPKPMIDARDDSYDENVSTLVCPLCSL
ncbi:hypothetical protein ACPV5U_19225 [Vibrio mediterranei]